MTMTELAKLAGVSQSTVSLVLNQREGRRINSETEQRILELASQHHFRVNRAAVELRKRTSSTIGVVMVTPHDPAYADKTAILQDHLQQLGYRPVFSFYSSLDKLEYALENILSHQVDGIISWDYHPLLDKEKIPSVIYETIHPNYDAVCLDGKLYADHVIRLAREYHHRRIHYLGALNNSRVVELRKSASEQNLDIEFTSVHFLPENAYSMMKELFSTGNPPSLILCNDYHALGVYSAANDCGMRIPDDFSIIGIDNLTASRFMQPPLTTFDLNIEDICGNLIDLLIGRIKNPGKKIEHVSVPIKLIMRKSIAERKV